MAKRKGENPRENFSQFVIDISHFHVNSRRGLPQKIVLCYVSKHGLGGKTIINDSEKRGVKMKKIKFIRIPCHVLTAFPSTYRTLGKYL